METKCEAFAPRAKISRARLEQQISKKKATVMQSKILENSSRDTFDGFVFRMKRQERRKRRPRRQKHPKFIGQESESTFQTNLLQGITRLPNRYVVNYLNLLLVFLGIGSEYFWRF